MKPSVGYRVASFCAVAFMWAGVMLLLAIAFVYAGIAGLLALSVFHIWVDYIRPMLQWTKHRRRRSALKAHLPSSR